MRRFLRFPKTVFAASFLGACAGPPPEPPSVPELPVSEVHRTWYIEGELPRRRWEVLRHADGRIEMHGRETVWFEDGVIAAEREYRHGEPAGTWRTWYPSGAQRSEVEIGAGDAALPMRFWHENGSLAGTGDGIGGVREGPWTYSYPDGTRAREGSFRRGLRHGAWSCWDERGRSTAEGLYEDGRRVGVWKLWDEDGVLHVRAPAEEEPDSDAASTEAEQPAEREPAPQ